MCYKQVCKAIFFLQFSKKVNNLSLYRYISGNLQYQLEADTLGHRHSSCLITPCILIASLVWWEVKHNKKRERRLSLRPLFFSYVGAVLSVRSQAYRYSKKSTGGESRTVHRHGDTDMKTKGQLHILLRDGFFFGEKTHKKIEKWVHTQVDLFADAVMHDKWHEVAPFIQHLLICHHLKNSTILAI